MLQITDIFDSAAVAVNRTSVASNSEPFVGQAFFPNKKKSGLSIKWLKTHNGLNAVLMPSNFDAIPVLRSREGFKMENTDLVFFREVMHVKEEDMMKIMDAQSSDSPYVQEILDSIYDDTNRLIDAAEIAAEVMRMQLLATNAGTPYISIGVGDATSDNMVYTYNYDPDGTYKANHYMKLTGTDTWDKNTAKPLNDFREATQYLRGIGVIPRYALMTSKTFDYLAETDQIKAAVISASGKAVDFVDQESVENIIAKKTRLTPVLYDKMYKGYDGNEKKFYPDDKVTIIGSSILGNTWYGTTPEERTLLGNPTVDVTMYDSRIAIAVKPEYGPPTKVQTSVSQLVVPSYEGIDSTFVIDVK